MNPNTRLLTQANSRLAKADIIKLLTDEEAWSSLPEDQQRTLYALLPTTNDPQQPPSDHTIHPLKTEFAPYIKHFLTEWQNDLRDGRNTLKWRNEARVASGERAAGVFDHVLAKEREDKWGSIQNVHRSEEDKKGVEKGEDEKVVEKEEEKCSLKEAEKDAVNERENGERGSGEDREDGKIDDGEEKKAEQEGEESDVTMD